MKIKFLIVLILFFLYNANAYIHPEVLMTETLQLQPQKNQSQWNPMLSSVTSNCTVTSGTADIITYVTKGWLAIQGKTYTAPAQFSGNDYPNLQYTTTISKDGQIFTYNNGTQTVDVKCDVHLFSDDE